MRVGFVSAFPPGRNSLNEYGLHFVRALAANPEVDEVVVFADRTSAGTPPAIPGVTVVPTWTFNRIHNLPKVAKAVRSTGVDAVLFNLQFASFGDRKVPGGVGLLTPALTRRLGIPTGVILHNLVENVDIRDTGAGASPLAVRLIQAAGTLLTRALLAANYVSLTIPRYVEMVRERYRVTNAILAPHGSFEDSLVPSFDIPDGPRRLLAFGKWGTYKKVDVLLEAYEQLLQRGYEDVEVWVAGTDTNNAPGYLEKVAAQYSHLPGVHFTGYVDEDDVPDLFGSATAVVFPYTSTTGSSGVLHQAGSYGRAAVLPLIGDFVEIIEEEGFLGEYFLPGDAGSLADALTKVLDDPIRRVDMGRRNYSAAAGIAMTDVVDWHVVHLAKLVDA